MRSISLGTPCGGRGQTGRRGHQSPSALHALGGPAHAMNQTAAVTLSWRPWRISQGTRRPQVVNAAPSPGGRIRSLTAPQPSQLMHFFFLYSAMLTQLTRSSMSLSVRVGRSTFTPGRFTFLRSLHEHGWLEPQHVLGHIWHPASQTSTQPSRRPCKLQCKSAPCLPNCWPWREGRYAHPRPTAHPRVAVLRQRARTVPSLGLVSSTCSNPAKQAAIESSSWVFSGWQASEAGSQAGGLGHPAHADT